MSAPLPGVIDGLVAAMVAEDVASILECFDPDGSFQDPTGRHEGRAALEAFFTMAFALVRDITWEIDEAFRSGAHFCFEWTFGYTLEVGKAAGSRVTIEGLSIIELRDERILRWRDYWDALPVLASLGATSWEELLTP